MAIITGVQPDVPTVTNEHGGRQSATPYAFHFLPPHAVFASMAQKSMEKHFWIGTTRKSRLRSM